MVKTQMKISIKNKIAQEVFTYISGRYNNGVTNFSRDAIVDEIKKRYPAFPEKFIARKIDKQLLFFCKLGILDNPNPKKRPLKGVTFKLSGLAPTILVENQGNPANDKNTLYQLASEINDRQYRMYSWYTTKFQNLLTIGSFLFAGIVLLISSFFSSAEVKGCELNCLSIIFLITSVMSLLALAVSVGFGLYNLIPKLSSKIGGNEDNIRSLVGMRRFLTLQKKLGKTEERKNFYSASFHYYDDFITLDDEQMLKFTVLQCIGMGKNNLRSEFELKIASTLMIFAFVAGIISIIVYGLFFIC